MLMAECNVYFITDKYGHIKIGMANNVKHRLNELSVAHAEPLEIFAVIHCWKREQAIELEYYLHTRFHRYKLSGEWFKIEPVQRWIVSNIFLLNNVTKGDISNIPVSKRTIELQKLLNYGRLPEFENNGIWYPAPAEAIRHWSPIEPKITKILDNNEISDNEKCSKILEAVLA